MEVIVPFSTRDPKSRLSSVLDPAERREFATVMCADVLEAVIEADGDPHVLATGSVDNDGLAGSEIGVTVDDRALTTAVNDALADRISTVDPSSGVAVVMADLAIATPRALDRLFEVGGDVVIAPGRGGGTNALVVRDSAFRVDYHGASYLDHRRMADEIGATAREIDSHRLATDIDEVADLAEVLVHGDGRSAAWLRDAGFEIDASDGRVGVVRN